MEIGQPSARSISILEETQVVSTSSIWLLKHHTVSLAQDLLSRDQLSYGIAEETLHTFKEFCQFQQTKAKIRRMGLVINLTSKNETHKQQ
jgi:hypothetical protein